MIVIIIKTCCNWAPCTVADKEKIAAAEESDVQAIAKAAQESSPPQAQVLPISAEQVGADAQISTAATESNSGENNYDDWQLPEDDWETIAWDPRSDHPQQA